MIENTNTYPSVDKPWRKYYTNNDDIDLLPEGSLYDYMKSCNLSNMDSIAFNYLGNKITYRQFDSLIESCAKALLSYNIKSGDIVSLCMLAIPEAMVLLYSLNRIGAICNFLVLSTTTEEIHKQIATTKSKIIFTIDLAAEQICTASQNSSVKTIINVPFSTSMPFHLSLVNTFVNRKKNSNLVSWKSFLKQGRNIELSSPKIIDSAVAVLEYTSGTTGESKGVMLSNRAINTVAFHYQHSSTVFEFNPKEKFLCVIPPFLAVGLVTTLVMPLCMGFELIMYPNPDPSLTSKYVRKFHPNHICGSPLAISNIITDSKNQKADFSFLKTIAYGGDKADPTWEKNAEDFFFKRGVTHKLCNGYGLTETAASFCTTSHKLNEMVPFFHNNVMIRDVDSKKELSYGQEGEICVSGPSLMEGYYNNQNATDDLFFMQNGERWMRTGDLGYVTPEGTFHITGRIKRIFWRMGNDNSVYRVYPMKIEEIICQCPNVTQCAVVGKKSGAEGYLPIAYIVLKDKSNCELSKEAILNKCSKELNSVSQPAIINFVHTIPTTRVGKIDFKKLEEQCNEE